jgi:hypothetical protein
VIYPRKGSGFSAGVEGVPPEPLVPSAPSLYEDAWDSPHQQKKLEESMRIARSISATSENFEDALEFLPDDWIPGHVKVGGLKKTEHSGVSSGSVSSGSVASASSGSGGTGVGRRSKVVDPVSGGAYEQAWDLNKGLEEKLRSIQLMHTGEEEGGESNYQEPWDTSKKQRELEERLQQAGIASKSDGSGACETVQKRTRQTQDQSPQHAQRRAARVTDTLERKTNLMAQQQSQQHEQLKQRQQVKPSPADGVYEDAWDTRQSLAKMLQCKSSCVWWKSVNTKFLF